MRAKISKWGNSLAVRLPKRYADELGLKPGSTIDLEREGTRVAIETAPRRTIPYYRLEDLLARIKPDTKSPSLEDWGILPSEWPQEDWSDVAPTDAEWEAWKNECRSRARAKRRTRKIGGKRRDAGQRGRP